MAVLSMLGAIHERSSVDVAFGDTGSAGRAVVPTPGGHGLRLDLTTIATPLGRLPVGVETADDDATPGVRLGTVRKDWAGHFYFVGSGDNRRTRQLQAIRRYGVAAWRRAPIPAQARAAIRTAVRARGRH